MTGDHRVLIVASLEVFFGCKLLVTGGLLWSILRDGFTGVTRHPALWPTVLILGSLALLQLFVIVGVARREDLARRVGGGVCIAGGSVGLVLVVFSPLTLLAGGLVFVLVPGLVLLLLNAFAFALLASDAVRDWCDEPPDDPRPTLAKVGRGGGSIGRAAASAALGGVAGGGALAVALSVIGAAVAAVVGAGVSECATCGAIVGAIAGAVGGVIGGWSRGATGLPAPPARTAIASVATAVAAWLLVWGPPWDRLMILAPALLALSVGAAIGDRVARTAEQAEPEFRKPARDDLDA